MYTTIKVKTLLLLIILVILVCSSCAGPEVVDITIPRPSVQYIIGPEDILDINVWKEPDLSGTVPVRPDGKISLPLLNDVDAAGLTPIQLKDVLTKALSKYVEDPTVSVSLNTINSFKFFVIGNVNTPGTFQVQREISIVQAISLAGGFTDWAKKNKLKILRKNKDSEQIITIKFKKIIQGKEPNVPIYPGDTIFVP